MRWIPGRHTVTGVVSMGEGIVGREYGPVRYEVGREKISEFASAIGETNLVFYSKDAAASSGYEEQIAPFTFPTVVTNILDELVRKDPDLEIDWEKVVDGEEEIVYYHHICAGDLLEATTRITGFETKGGLLFLRLDTDLVNIRDRARNLLCTVKATLIARVGDA